MSSKIARRFVILDLDGGGWFRFHAMFDFDGGYTVSKSANWISTGIIGRSSPIQGYQDSSPASWSLDIPIFSSMEQGDSRTTKDVDNEARFFLSMTYPDYKGGGIRPPHKYLIIPGGQIIFYTVIPQSVDVNFLGPWDENGMSHRVRVRASFIEVDDVPKGWADVRKPGG